MAAYLCIALGVFQVIYIHFHSNEYNRPVR